MGKCSGVVKPTEESSAPDWLQVLRKHRSHNEMDPRERLDSSTYLTLPYLYPVKGSGVILTLLFLIIFYIRAKN